MTLLFRVRWNKIDARKGHFFFNLTLFRFAVAEVVKRPPPPAAWVFDKANYGCSGEIYQRDVAWGLVAYRESELMD